MAALTQYDIARQQLRQQIQRQQQSNDQQLKRQFARLGGLGTGSYIKASQQNARDALM